MTTQRSKSGGQASRDLWELADAIAEDDALDSDASGDTTTLFVGDSGCGKSTLIQSFLKPNISKVGMRICHFLL